MSHNQKKSYKNKFSFNKDRIVDASHQDNFIFNKTPILASALKKLKAKSVNTSSVPKPAKRNEPIDLQESKPSKKVKKSLQDIVSTLSYTPLQRDLYNFFTINKLALKNYDHVPQPKFEVGSIILTALCDRGIGGKFLVSNIFRNKKCYIDFREVSLFNNQKKNQQILQKYQQPGQFVVGTVVKGRNDHHIQLTLNNLLIIDQKQIKIGQVFPAQIKSKQQLGCLLIVSGIKNYKIFLSKNKIQEQQYSQLTEDKQIIVVIKQVQEAKKIIKVVLATQQQIPMNFKGLQQQDLSKMQLDQYVYPGTLVNTKIIKVLSNGVIVKFLKIFIGFIHCDHLNRNIQSYASDQKLLARVIFYCMNPPMIYLSQKHVNITKYQPKYQLYGEITKPSKLQERQGSFFNRDEQIFIHNGQLVNLNLSTLNKLYIKQNNYFQKYQILSSKKIGVVVGQIAKVVPFTNFKIYGQKQNKQGHRFRVMCLDQWNKVIKISYDQKIIKAKLQQFLLDTDQVDQKKKYIGFISNVNPNGVVIQFCNNIKGILSKNELKLAQIQISADNIGQSFQVYIYKVKKGYLGLTLKSAQMRATQKKNTKGETNNKEQQKNEQSTQMGTIQSINKKSIYPIYIKLKNNKFAKISIFDGVRAPSLNQAHIISDLEQHYTVGQNVRVFRKGKGYFLYPPQQMKDPQLRFCKIVGVKGSHLRVQTGDKQFRNCHITNITDIITPYPLSEYKLGEYVLGRILSQSQICLRLSIVKSGVPKSMQQCLTRYAQAQKHGDLRNRLLTVGSSALKTDMVCFGYIKSYQQNGCFVSLSHEYEVRVQRSELSDVYLKDKQKEFKVNKLVLCRLINSKVKNNQPNRVFYDASLRQSVIKYGYPLNDQILEHGVGLTVQGTIKGYTKGKALVQLHSSKYTGIIAMKDVQGGEDQTIQKALPIGMNLKFKITQYSFDGQKRLIRLCNLQKIFLKFKTFETKFEADDRLVKLWQNFKQLQAFEPPQQANQLVNQKQILLNQQDQQQRIMNLLAMGQMQQEEDKQKSQEQNRQVEEQKQKMDEEQSQNDDIEEEGSQNEQIENQQMDQQQSEQENKIDQVKDKQSKLIKKQQNAQLKQKTNLFEKMPHPPTFYHSLVLANPTPQSWLMYISALLPTSSPDQIRHQFLKSIQSFGQIKDKDNMWISWINMQLILGDLMGTVKKAIQNNVGSNVYFRILDILVEKEEWDIAIQFGRKMLKKFNKDMKTYIQFLKMVYQYEASNKHKINEAISQKQILRRASQCLKSHQLITIESHIAKHLFDTKQYQKGRNIFQQLISKHPKRTDLWSMYVDMQIKANQINKSRNLLQRILSLQLNKKQTKSILKKYYLLEQQHGTQKQAKAILQRAKKLAQGFQEKQIEQKSQSDQE